MNELVKEYIAGMTEKALDNASVKGRLDFDCFNSILALKAVKKYERVDRLLEANKVIKKARTVDLGEKILKMPPLKGNRTKAGKPKLSAPPPPSAPISGSLPFSNPMTRPLHQPHAGSQAAAQHMSAPLQATAYRGTSTPSLAPGAATARQRSLPAQPPLLPPGGKR